MKKSKNILINYINNLMGCFIGVFIGNCISVYSTFQKYPEIYDAQSAPWWVNLIPYGSFTIVVLTILLIAKVLIILKTKRNERSDSYEKEN